MITALTLGCACGGNQAQARHPRGAGLQSDPHFYKLNSVMGEVTAGGKAVPGATVTVVETNQQHPVEASGVYIFVIEPGKHGRRNHDLVFSAPGYNDAHRTVDIPENNRTRLDVELTPVP